MLAEEGYLAAILVWDDVLVTMGNAYNVRLWDRELNLLSEHKFLFRSWCGAVVAQEYGKRERRRTYNKKKKKNKDEQLGLT